MSANTGISWTQATWNPVRGCERVSEGCRHCYAEIMAARHSYAGGWGEGLAKFVRRPDGSKEARWTGKIRTLPRLDQPLRWRAPRRIFVNSMSDLFHEDVPDEFLNQVFGVMAMASQHTFQILTKRPERMLAYLGRPYVRPVRMEAPNPNAWPCKPLPNVWLGVSAEDQETFDERVEILARVPAAVRFVSLEPLIGTVNTERLIVGDDALRERTWIDVLNWVIVGGESGHDRREMDIENARDIIAQCDAAGVPVFVKQDSGPRPGMQGRFTDAEWARKEFPA